MARRKKADLDLNNDGVFDEKDKSIAAKALATKIDKSEKEEVVEQEEKLEESKVEEPVKEEEVSEGRKAKIDINLKYREGDLVPEEVVKKWEEMGLDISSFF